MQLPDGRIVHWYDCSVCIHQHTQTFPARGRAKPAQHCTCRLDGHRIPPPFDPGPVKRWCGFYQNRDCPCERCRVDIRALAPQNSQDVTVEIQSEHIVDK